METLLAPELILIHYKFSLIYSLKRSLIEVFDLVFSSTCLIITAHDNDGAEGLFLSGKEPGTRITVVAVTMAAGLSVQFYGGYFG